MHHLFHQQTRHLKLHGSRWWRHYCTPGPGCLYTLSTWVLLEPASCRVDIETRSRPCQGLFHALYPTPWSISSLSKRQQIYFKFYNHKLYIKNLNSITQLIWYETEDVAFVIQGWKDKRLRNNFNATRPTIYKTLTIEDLMLPNTRWFAFSLISSFFLINRCVWICIAILSQSSRDFLKIV